MFQFVKDVFFGITTVFAEVDWCLRVGEVRQFIRLDGSNGETYTVYCKMWTLQSVIFFAAMVAKIIEILNVDSDAHYDYNLAKNAPITFQHEHQIPVNF